ncbi:DUF4279 domain-containing protein [Botrimarina colliarenosi]
MSAVPPSQPGRSRCVRGLNDYEYCFSLHVEGGRFPREAVTSLVGIEPRSSHSRGERRVNRRGEVREGVWPSHYWSAPMPTVQDASLSESVQALVSRLKANSDPFAKLSMEGARISLFVGIFSNRLCDDEFPATLLAELGQLGIALRLDYYGNESVTPS